MSCGRCENGVGMLDNFCGQRGSGTYMAQAFKWHKKMVIVIYFDHEYNLFSFSWSLWHADYFSNCTYGRPI